MSDPVVYVSYNEIESPLVESQVLRYLRRLSKLGYSFELVTFEPSAPSEDDQARIRGELATDSIAWTWLRRPQRTRPVAAVWSILKSVWVIRGLLRQSGVRLVHARSFIPAVMAAMSARGAGVPLLYDIRGFWVEEKLMRGSLHPGGMVHRVLKWIDRRVYCRSAAVVSLTAAAVPTIETLYRKDIGVEPPPIEVIPTCVDVQRFESEGKRLDPLAPVFCSLGSLGAGYLGEALFRFFETILRRAFPGSRLVVASRTDLGAIRDMALEGRVRESHVEYVSAEPAHVPALLSRCDVGLIFMEPHRSREASLPTKLAEYLAAGLPVISIAGIGDVDHILEANRVGMSVPGRASLWNEVPIGQLTSLLQDPGMVDRCRDTARRLFSLDLGVSRYAAIYSQIGQNSLQTRAPVE